MKKLLVCLMILALLVGCNGEKPAKEKVVTIQVPSDVISMDTQIATDGGSFSAQDMCMAGLIELDENNLPVCDLAESYTIDETGTVYTFKIKENAIWSNGAPITAHDFVYAWKRVVNPDFASEYNWFLETANIVGASCYDPDSGYTVDDLGVVALDDKTLQVTLTKPSGFFLSMLAFPTLFPLNEEFVEAQGDQYALSVDNMIYSGPWVMSAWEANYSYEFTINDKYWNYENFKTDKTPDKIIFRVVNDTQTALMEYESGLLDTVNLSGEQVEANKEKPGFTRRLSGYLFYLLININKTVGPTAMTNVNARLAMSYAIDRETIATVLNDGSVAAEGIIPFSLANNPETGKDFRDDNGSVMEYNEVKAKEYYDKAVAELGNDVTINLIYDTDQGDSEIKAAEQIQFFLEKVGFTVELNGKPKNTRLMMQRATLEGGKAEFDVSLTRWGPDYGDPQTYMDLFTSWRSTGGYASEAYDMLVKHAEAADTDPLTRWEDFLAAEKVLVTEDAGIVPIFQAGSAMLISPKITGIRFHVAAVDSYRHIVFVD